MVSLGMTMVLSCEKCAGSDHTGGVRQFITCNATDVSLCDLCFHLCKMNEDVANMEDAGWDFTLSADYGPRTLGPGYDDGMRRSSSMAPLGRGCG